MAESALAKQPQSLTRLLLVEDNPSDVFLIRNLLGNVPQAHYKVRHVRMQSEALMALAEQPYDVCLLDLTLPDANGFSALIDIQEKAPEMPVLILTGTNNMALSKRAVGRGAQDYLLKDSLEVNALGRSIDYALERKRLEKKLFHRANHDTLTELANRDLFVSRLKMALARSKRSGAAVAVLFIDLDRFKPINDTHGHDAGDEILRAVATRLKQTLRAYDTAARFGGDEFAVLLEAVDSPRHVAAIAQKILGELATPVPYHSNELKVSASIGIAFSETPLSSDILLQHADAAMYYAKKDGGNAYHFYASDMHDEAELRLKMEEDLRTALMAQQLKLYYQPYVTPDGEAVLGIETLLRWHHPEHGLLTPGEFLEIAEECRLMPLIGKWMFSALRHDIMAWNAASTPPLQIAVNVSSSQLDMPGLLDWVTPLTEAGALGQHKLVLEIADDAMMPFLESRFLTLSKLREMGIGLHLDNFGRGPISLQALHTLPFSLLKLDLSLMKRMSETHQADAMILTAIELAHQLGMKAAAVGVEVPWQMQTLKAQRCDAMQGFLVSHPMTAQQLVKWLVKP